MPAKKRVPKKKISSKRLRYYSPTAKRRVSERYKGIKRAFRLIEKASFSPQEAKILLKKHSLAVLESVFKERFWLIPNKYYADYCFQMEVERSVKGSDRREEGSVLSVLKEAGKKSLEEYRKFPPNLRILEVGPSEGWIFDRENMIKSAVLGDPKLVKKHALISVDKLKRMVAREVKEKDLELARKYKSWIPEHQLIADQPRLLIRAVKEARELFAKKTLPEWVNKVIKQHQEWEESKIMLIFARELFKKKK
ncbi:hypothetical protein KKG83_07520 [Candidatus Micrarchaeota archaeon]|nr:hypothetical protein [Candidatus Micrarchaeota archaeon]MBU2477289.1 hypothetical protein [Candidatus Micrarchaeota archaeon]